MPSYKFNYFDLRGKGETCRLCFIAAGVSFKDHRIDYAAWPGNYKAETPFGQLPYLEIDGKKFAQSGAIASYISREYGLYGTSSLEALSIDGVVGLAADYFTMWAKSHFEADAGKKTELQLKLKDTDLPSFLANLEKILTANGSGYYVGNQLTLADLSVYDILENSYRDYPSVYSSYPKVLANRKKIAALPRIAEYLSKRNVTEI
ncbi:S-crystallin SL11 [Patella vulgata]|uniref:S-crystallin SL11 n=1 Tax=Patella vulgata TaxID=6465 RepID=UPI00217F7708|nr:S-crystallin SL11 [Patella vulgata]